MWPEVGKEADELAVETVAGIVDQTIVVPNLAVRLAGRAASQQVDLLQAKRIDQLIVASGAG